MTDLTIGYHDELAPERRVGPVANRKELSEVTGLDKIGLSNRLHHMISFDGHLWVAVDDVSPPLISKPYGNTVD